MFSVYHIHLNLINYYAYYDALDILRYLPIILKDLNSNYSLLKVFNQLIKLQPPHQQTKKHNNMNVIENPIVILFRFPFDLKRLQLI